MFRKVLFIGLCMTTLAASQPLKVSDAKTQGSEVKLTQDVTAANATLMCSNSSDGKLLCKPIESGDIELTTKNLIVLRGPISAQSASKFVAQFHELEHRDEVQKIYIYLMSPGGSIFAGDYIANMISSSKKEVVVVVDFAASMAFHIMHYANKRLMLPTGTIMQHHASGAPGGGEFPNVDKQWDWIKRKVDMMAKHDAAACKNVTFEQFQKNIDRDWWLLSQEALDAGCIDGIATRVTCSKDLSNQVTTDEFSFFGIVITLRWSGCPLETYPRQVQVSNGSGFSRLTPEQQQAADEFMMLVTDPLQYYNLKGSFDIGRFIDKKDKAAP